MTDRPLVTFALFAYNQEKYIREAVEGAFSQTYEPLEIILSDDCSSDRTYQIMQEMAAAYTGPHEVKVRQSEVNKGISNHFTEVVKFASGHFVVLGAGDDISLSQRTTDSTLPLIENKSLNFSEVIAHNFEGSPPTASHWAGCRAKVADDRSRTFSIFDYIENRAPTLIGAARTVRRSAILEYQDLDEHCPTEDTPSIVRLLMTGDGVNTGNMSLLRRLHNNNLSRTGFKDPSKFILIEKQYRSDIKSLAAKKRISPDLERRLLSWAGSRTIRKIQGVLFVESDSKLKKALKLLANRDVLARHKAISVMDIITRKLNRIEGK